MGMSLCLMPQVSLRQEQRLELEQRIEQKVEQKLAMTMSLQQYLEQEDFFKGLIKWVDDNNRWKQFKKWGFNFRYGLVPYNKVKHIADEYGLGFAHCFYEPFFRFDKGDWSLFVVDDMIPKEYEGIIALHERGEELSLGDHFFASKLEFAGARKKVQIKNYIMFIDKNYPTKFVDLIEKVLFPILPDELRDYLEQQDKHHNKEIDIAERMIEEYPLPTSVMKFVIKYDDINKEVGDKFKEFWGPCQKAIYEAKTLEEAVNSLNQIVSNSIKSIPEEYFRILVPRRMKDSIIGPFNSIKDDFSRKYKSHNLDIDNNLFKLYNKIKKREPIVCASKQF
jgi:hypothetical protein